MTRVASAPRTGPGGEAPPAGRTRPRGRRGSARIALAGLLLLAGAPGCTTRDPLNPLDPGNPETQGEPQWLEVRADDGAVDLEWDVPWFRDVVEVRVRDLGADEILWSGGPGGARYRQEGVPNEVDREYRIELALASPAVRELPPEAATPGTAIPWVVDFGSGRVSRLTPDGRWPRLGVSALSATSVVVDPETADVLSVEFFSSRVRLLDREGHDRWIAAGLGRPLVALNTAAGWWVGDPGVEAVYLLDAAGEFVYGDTAYVFPVDLAPASGDGVWVADGDGRLVRLEPGRGATLEVEGFESPGALAGGGDGGVWVADDGTGALVRVDASGAELARRTDILRIFALAPDPVLPGGVWVAERGTGALHLLDGGGTTVVTVPGLSAPSSVAVSPDGAEIWVADPALNHVLRFDRSGTELSRSRGVSSPTSVAVAFEPAAARARAPGRAP